MKIFAYIAIVLGLLTANAYSQMQYDRKHGVSAHALPQRVASKDPSLKWGYEITYADYLKPEPEKPVLQTADDLLAFVRKQDNMVVSNGLWIVYTNPLAYNDDEKKLQQDVIDLFQKERIPLFIVRGAELPDGWKQMSPQK